MTRRIITLVLASVFILSCSEGPQDKSGNSRAIEWSEQCADAPSVVEYDGCLLPDNPSQTDPWLLDPESNGVPEILMDGGNCFLVMPVSESGGHIGYHRYDEVLALKDEYAMEARLKVESPTPWTTRFRASFSASDDQKTAFINLVTVNGDAFVCTADQTGSTCEEVAIDAYRTYRIEVSKAGKATFYQNGSQFHEVDYDQLLEADEQTQIALFTGEESITTWDYVTYATCGAPEPEVPCAEGLDAVNFEGDTLPEDDPVAPWIPGAVGDATASVENGVLIIEAGPNSYMTYSRDEPNIEIATVYSIETKVCFSNLVIPPTQSTASIAIRDGEKEAALFFQDGLNKRILVDHKAGRTEYEIDWEDCNNPHEYRFVVLKGHKMSVFVDDQFAFAVSYEDLFDDTDGDGGLFVSGFFGAESTSYWDYIRYEVCAVPASAEDRPPIEVQIDELREEVAIADLRPSVRNWMLNHLDQVERMADPLDQGDRLHQMGNKLLMERFSGKLLEEADYLDAKLDFARTTVYPTKSRQVGFKRTLEITDVEVVDGAFKPEGREFHIVVHAELDPSFQNVSNNNKYDYGIRTGIRILDMSTGASINKVDSWHKLPSRSNDPQTFQFDITWDGLDANGIMVDPGDDYFFSVILEYAQLELGTLDPNRFMDAAMVPMCYHGSTRASISIAQDDDNCFSVGFKNCVPTGPWPALPVCFWVECLGCPPDIEVKCNWWPQ